MILSFQIDLLIIFECFSYNKFYSSVDLKNKLVILRLLHLHFTNSDLLNSKQLGHKTYIKKTRKQLLCFISVICINLISYVIGHEKVLSYISFFTFCRKIGGKMNWNMKQHKVQFLLVSSNVTRSSIYSLNLNLKILRQAFFEFFK